MVMQFVGFYIELDNLMQLTCIECTCLLFEVQFLSYGS